MKPLSLPAVTQYVEEHIGEFHQRRIQGVERLKLESVLKRKNPYLFKVNNVLTVEELVRGITDAHISSSDETLFGNWLEGLAVFINGQVYGGRKSGILGIDLEFDRDGTRHIVAIKSGPNWGNSSQIAKMKTDFERAKKTLRTSDSHLVIEAVNGCCYGRDDHPDKGAYHKYCGQRFWEFISGSGDLYTSLIEPLGHRAKECNEAFAEAYARVVNRFTQEFGGQYLLADGTIDWDKLVRFNSQAALSGRSVAS